MHAAILAKLAVSTTATHPALSRLAAAGAAGDKRAARAAAINALHAGGLAGRYLTAAELLALATCAFSWRQDVDIDSTTPTTPTGDTRR